MPPIEYIGAKPRKTDNVADTGTVWAGPGDVQNVSDAAWAALSKHPNVWRLAPASLAGLINTEPPALQDTDPVIPPDLEVPPAPPAAEPPEGKYVLEQGDEATPTYIVLDTMDADALKAFAAANGLKYDGRIKDMDRQRAALYAQATGKED